MAGAAPVQWAILSGEKTSGISIFKLDKGMDTGPIYLTHEVVLDSNAKSDEVLLAFSDIAAAKTLKCLELIYAQKEPYSQPIDGASIAPKFTKNDGKIDWQKVQKVSITYTGQSRITQVFGQILMSKG